MFSRIYNLHNVVVLRITSRAGCYIKHFDQELNFCIDNTDNSLKDKIDIDIYVDCHHSRLADEEREFIYEQTYKRFFKIRYVIDGIKESKTNVYFRGDNSVYLYPFIMSNFLYSIIIEPLIYFKCLKKNYLIMHASCLSDGRYAYLFPACGGTGKTMVALCLANKGMDFLGDDLVLVSNTGMVYAFPKPLHLFDYLIKLFPFLHISKKIKYEIKIKNILRAIATLIIGEEIGLATRIYVQDVLPQVNIGDACPIKKIFFLSQDCELKEIKFADEKEKDLYIKRIIDSIEINAQFLKLFDKRASELCRETQQMEKSLIADIINKSQGDYLVNPYFLVNSDFKRIEDLL